MIVTFQTAESIRRGEIEPPAVGIEHVLHDREPEAGAFAALIEPDAAFEHARHRAAGRDARPVVLDRRLTARDGAGLAADANARRSHAASHCREGCREPPPDRSDRIGTDELVGDVRLERRRARRRASATTSRSASGRAAQARVDSAGSRGDPCRARARAPARGRHGGAWRRRRLRYRARSSSLPCSRKRSRIGRERRERRLQSVREIGGPAARALDLPLLRVEQRVDLLDQRPDLGRAPRAADGGCVPSGCRRRRGAAHRAAAARGRPGPRSRSPARDRAGRARRARSVAKAVAARRYAREIDRDRDAHRHASVADRQADPPLRDQHARVGRPGHLVLMHLARRRLVDRQRQGRVPQRARAQELAAVVADLPVQARQRIGEARDRRAAASRRAALRHRRRCRRAVA